MNNEANERRAIGLYAVAARDVCDFIDMLEVEPAGVLRLLYDMLTTPNPKHTKATIELNQLVAPIVKRRLDGMPSDA